MTLSVSNVDPLRVLVLAPRGRDAALTGELLADANIAYAICSDVHALCRAIEEGAGTALVTEEALTPSSVVALAELLARQPAWSDFPILVFGLRSATDNAAVAAGARLGNITFIDRPVTVRTMLAAVHVALRGRRRQYEARRAIESRDQFLAMLGHELRNPLSAFTLALDLLAGKGREPGQLEKYTAILDRQATHLTRLVDDLLDVARVSYGKVTLKRIPLNVNDVLRTVVQSRLSASARSHDVKMSLDPKPLFVLGDVVRLEQIFGNLLTNAVKYTPAGGTIEIMTSREGGQAIVSVRDTGIGIEADMLGRVFDLFAQADRSLDRAQGGMGVGLTVTQNLVHLHGGSIVAQSEGLGRGSEFVVRLPLETDERDIRSRTDGQVATHDRRRFVCVEDNADIREMLTELLEGYGHEVTVAVDGPDGVARILSARPDVALVDIGLPLCDGFEVARRVRSAGLSEVVLIAVTGYGQPDDRRRAVEAGFDHLLTKPVTLVALHSAIDATCGARVPSRAATLSST